MSLLDTFRRAIGLDVHLTPKDHSRLGFTPAAKRRLAELPEGEALHIDRLPHEGGFLVRAVEGPAEGPPPPGYTEAIVISDRDLAGMAGLLLDWKGDRWAVALELEVRARSTPNPDGRLYEADRTLALGRPQFFTPSPANPALARRILAIPGIRTALFRDNALTVEREPGLPWDRLDRVVDVALREHFLLGGVPLAPEDKPAQTGDLAAAVQRVIEDRILPGIHQDGGDLELISVEDGVVTVNLVGACRTCPASTLTLKAGIERTLREAFPGQIHEVRPV